MSVTLHSSESGSKRSKTYKKVFQVLTKFGEAKCRIYANPDQG